MKQIKGETQTSFIQSSRNIFTLQATHGTAGEWNLNAKVVFLTFLQ